MRTVPSSDCWSLTETDGVGAVCALTGATKSTNMKMKSRTCTSLRMVTSFCKCSEKQLGSSLPTERQRVYHTLFTKFRWRCAAQFAESFTNRDKPHHKVRAN